MMPFPHAGQLAALATACCWTLAALFFEAASKRIGALTVNIGRLVIAMAFISLYCKIVRGYWLPLDATAHNWFWLLISGAVGILVGDMCLFRAFVLIGARKAMLIMSLAPPLTALAGWLLMNEWLTLLDWAAMALTVAGVSWVVMEREPREKKAATGTSLLGLALALVSATAQAIGLVLSKFGMEGYDPFAANQIRILAAVAGLVILITVLKWWTKVKGLFLDSTAMGWTAMGAFFGTFLGISLSLLAVQLTETGVAATIMSIVPILIIPPAVFFFKEKVTLRSVLGAFLAVAGVSLLFL